MKREYFTNIFEEGLNEFENDRLEKGINILDE